MQFVAHDLRVDLRVLAAVVRHLRVAEDDQKDNVEQRRQQKHLRHERRELANINTGKGDGAGALEQLGVAAAARGEAEQREGRVDDEGPGEQGTGHKGEGDVEEGKVGRRHDAESVWEAEALLDPVDAVANVAEGAADLGAGGDGAVELAVHCVSVRERSERVRAS